MSGSKIPYPPPPPPYLYPLVFAVTVAVGAGLTNIAKRIRQSERRHSHHSTYRNQGSKPGKDTTNSPVTNNETNDQVDDIVRDMIFT
jgi:hypothetical protein